MYQGVERADYTALIHPRGGPPLCLGHTLANKQPARKMRQQGHFHEQGKGQGIRIPLCPQSPLSHPSLHCTNMLPQALLDAGAVNAACSMLSELWAQHACREPIKRRKTAAGDNQLSSASGWAHTAQP